MTSRKTFKKSGRTAVEKAPPKPVRKYEESTLNIDDPKNSSMGFLAYDHMEPFEIGPSTKEDLKQKVYSSIAGYVASKYFEGVSSEIEEKIRLAPNPSLISRKVFKTTKKIIILPSGDIIKKKVYVSGIQPKKLSEPELERFIRLAIETKFGLKTPRGQWLLKSFPVTFSSELNPLYASVLTNYRNEIYQKTFTEERISKKIGDLQTDLPSANLELRYQELLSILEDYVTKIKNIEGMYSGSKAVRKNHIGIYDDALWNMVPKKRAERILSTLKMDTVIKTMPRQNEMVSRCFEYLGKKFPNLITTQEFRSLANEMWATFRWQILEWDTSEAKVLRSLKSDHLRFKPIKRPYRKAVTTKRSHLRSIATRTKEYALLFGKDPDYDHLVDKYETMEPIKRDREIDQLLKKRKVEKALKKEKKQKHLTEKSAKVTKIQRSDVPSGDPLQKKMEKVGVRNFEVESEIPTLPIKERRLTVDITGSDDTPFEFDFLQNGADVVEEEVVPHEVSFEVA